MLGYLGRKLLGSKRCYLYYHWSCTSRHSEPINSFTIQGKGKAVGQTTPLFLLLQNYPCPRVLHESFLEFSEAVTALHNQVGIFLSRPSDLQFSAGFVNTQSLPCISLPSSSRSLARVRKTANPLPHHAFISKALAFDVIRCPSSK